MVHMRKEINRLCLDTFRDIIVVIVLIYGIIEVLVLEFD